MSWLHKLRALFRKEQLDAEMAEEMRAHLEFQTAENERRGMSREGAHHAARRSFGGVEQIKERCRDERGAIWLEQLLQDIRFAVRSLRRNPGFTTVAVLTLGLGIGANTAIFSVVNAVMLKSLPVAAPAELVLVTHHGKNGPADKPAHFANFPLYEFLRERSRSFAGLGAFAPTHVRVRRDGANEGVAAQWVTANYFATVGVRPVLGRTWTVDDEAQPTGVVISHRFWQRFFGGDPAVVGKTISIGGRPANVVGVAPPEFLGLVPGSPLDLTMLLAAQPTFQPQRGNLLTLGRGAQEEPMPLWELHVFGRLPAGGAPAPAAAETALLLRQWATSRQAPAALIDAAFSRVELMPCGKGLDGLRQRFSAPLWALAGMVAGVFLIACANLANLLLARATARRHEIAVRVAIGASRGRLIRQLLTESLTLTLFGGAAGIVLGWWGSSFLSALIATGRTPLELEVQPDWRVLVFTIVASLVAGLAVGLVPALRGSSAALKERGAPGGGRGGRWNLGQTLVATQLALSLCLLVVTGLFAANLRRIVAIAPGFHADDLLSVAFDWAGAGSNRAEMMMFAQRAVEQARGVPGVQAASATHIEPLGTQQSQRWLSVRGAAGADANSRVVDLNVVSGDYFATMQLPLVRGRAFDNRDRADTAKVAIISEALARACFGDADPIGQSAWIARDTNGAPLTIVGVARDAKQRDLRETSLPMLFLPATQSAAWEMNLLVRTAGNPLVIAGELRRALAAMNADVAVREITTPRIQMERGLLQERLLATLSGFFGPLALLLAAIGLYGLLAYDVAQRTREIGVRMALGAHHTQVLGLVLRRGMTVVAVGTLVGIAAALALARVLRGFLFAIGPSDPATLLLAAGVLGLVAWLACWLPARRAAKVDPMVALRSE